MNDQAILSPRLAALDRAVAAGETGALAAFWQEVAVQGAPLVEPLPDEPGYALLTFLWRAEGPTDNVVVLCLPAMPRLDAASSQLRRLRDTDLWYRTYRVRSDARFSYRLKANDSLVDWRDVTDWNARTRGFVDDPLNPRRFVTPKDDENPRGAESARSVVELPDAPAEPWVTPRPGVPRGRLERYRRASPLLELCPWPPPADGPIRRVWLYQSADPPTGDRWLLILLGGWSFLGVIPVPTILDNLRAERRIPPVAAALVDSPAPVQGELRASPFFRTFLAEELIPWLRQQCALPFRPERTLVGGIDLAGLAAADLALHHPDLVGNVLLQSAAIAGPGWEPAEVAWLQQTLQSLGQPTGRKDGYFDARTAQALAACLTRHGLTIDGKGLAGGPSEATFRALAEVAGQRWRPASAANEREAEWLSRQIARRPTQALRFSIQVGRYETQASAEGGPSLVLANRHLRTVLEAKGYSVAYTEFSGGHAHPSWRAGFPEALLKLCEICEGA